MLNHINDNIRTTNFAKNAADSSASVQHASGPRNESGKDTLNDTQQEATEILNNV